MEDTSILNKGIINGTGLPGVEQVVGVAKAGLHLGLGLAVMTVEAGRVFASKAIERGAKVQKDGVDTAVEMERKAVSHMKDYLKRTNGKKEEKNETLEARIEQALATFDVPTKDDIRELHLHLAAVSEKISELQKA